jgi:hypothetical protein
LESWATAESHRARGLTELAEHARSNLVGLDQEGRREVLDLLDLLDLRVQVVAYREHGELPAVQISGAVDPKLLVGVADDQPAATPFRLTA